MPRLRQPTPKQERDYKEWVASRPELVRQVAERFDTWSLYRQKSTGRRVLLTGFREDGTVCADVTGECQAEERAVYGIDPDDLELCSVPSPADPVGRVLNDDEIAENIHALRVLFRPDLYEMGADGVSRRRGAGDERKRA